MVSRVVYGKGSITALPEILAQQRKSGQAFVYLIDDVFEQNPEFLNLLPRDAEDHKLFISAAKEPTTQQVDEIVSRLGQLLGNAPSGIIGIGGGTLLDIAKAVSVMLTNSGSAADYQGWDLVQKPAIYHIGIPTISGTGAEVSRTAVLIGPQKKLGINSDFTPFDQVILDPDLCVGIPHDQWFYTAMDCFIHCVEALNGTYLNEFSKTYGKTAYDLCLTVFNHANYNSDENREKLMMASWHGGMSIAYSQVGIAHALSYGLSYLLGIRHGIGNCMAFEHLETYYPEGVRQYKNFKKIHNINLPKGVTKHLSEAELDKMTSIAWSLSPLWENALGKDWQQKISKEAIKSIYSNI
ncbi:MAG: iron-containing alcohol dehydrogenase family protein [Flavobacteriaceae bacterium]|nr:iron-containing alcohol dehydrogenase family protein [Flavobacteriaceae bacterium]